MSIRAAAGMPLWFPFVAASVLSVVVYVRLWMTPWYGLLLVLLGVVSFVSAARVILHCGCRFWPLLAIAVGLVVGQWWLIERLLVWALWSISGFAP